MWLQFPCHASIAAPPIDVNRWDEKAGLRTGCGVRSQVIDVLEAQIKRRPAMKKISITAGKQITEVDKQMAAPAETRTPNLHRANQSAPIEECGWKGGDSGDSA